MYLNTPKKDALIMSIKKSLKLILKLVDGSIENEKLSELIQLSKQVKGFGRIKERSFKTFKNKINTKSIRHLEI